jgi:hypothetical protein
LRVLLGNFTYAKVDLGFNYPPPFMARAVSEGGVVFALLLRLESAYRLCCGRRGRIGLICAGEGAPYVEPPRAAEVAFALSFALGFPAVILAALLAVAAPAVA